MHKYYVQENDEQQGPFTLNELAVLRKITEHTIVWRDGMDEWQKAESVEELNPLFHTAPPPLPKKSPTAVKNKSNATTVMFVALIIILAVAFLTNPNPDQHRYEASTMINGKLEQLKAEIKPKKKFLKVIKEVAFTIASGHLQNKIREKITSDDYYFCSLTKLKLKNQDVTVGFGALGSVWLFTESIDNLDPNSLVE